jgi:transcriptional regulator
MYVPRHFAPPDATAIAELLGSAGVSDLVTFTNDGLVCSTLPFLFEPDIGPLGSLYGHLARANAQWRTEPLVDALVIVHGPDAYVSPSWYATKREGGRVVPTWNYVVTHVYGQLVFHDDPDWTETLVRRLTARHEATHPVPWTPDDAPRDFIVAQLRMIVGIELKISRIEGKWKLSQNRGQADVIGVADSLDRIGGEGGRAVAEAMRHAKPSNAF